MVKVRPRWQEDGNRTCGHQFLSKDNEPMWPSQKRIITKTFQVQLIVEFDWRSISLFQSVHRTTEQDLSLGQSFYTHHYCIFRWNILNLNIQEFIYKTFSFPQHGMKCFAADKIPAHVSFSLKVGNETLFLSKVNWQNWHCYSSQMFYQLLHIIFVTISALRQDSPFANFIII